MTSSKKSYHDKGHVPSSDYLIHLKIRIRIRSGLSMAERSKESKTHGVGFPNPTRIFALHVGPFSLADDIP